MIGLDHGSRRIGIAVGDDETGRAFPRPALMRRNLAVDLEAAENEGDVRGIVLAVSVHLDGTRVSMSLRVREPRLHRPADSEVEGEAGEQLAAAGRRPNRRSGEKDSAAACLILQEWLDRRRPNDSNA